MLKNAPKKRKVEFRSCGMETSVSGRQRLADLRRRMEAEKNWIIQKMDSWKLESILEDLPTWWTRKEKWSGRHDRELLEIKVSKDKEIKRKARSTRRIENKYRDPLRCWKS